MAKTDVKKIFGATVCDWRNQLGISQEELAERADLHRTYVSDIERGSRNVSLQNIVKLACALEISVATLFPQSELLGEKAGASQSNGKNMVEVLFVEDNPDDVELTLQAFKKARFTNHVHVVNDGAEALDYIFCQGKYAGRRERVNPQIILLDLTLPKVSGIEVLRRIKADKRTQDIPVVVLTMSQNDNELAECRRLGAENYIAKPVNFQRLSQATPRLNLAWALITRPELKVRSDKGKRSWVSTDI